MVTVTARQARRSVNSRLVTSVRQRQCLTAPTTQSKPALSAAYIHVNTQTSPPLSCNGATARVVCRAQIVRSAEIGRSPPTTQSKHPYVPAISIVNTWSNSEGHVPLLVLATPKILQNVVIQTQLPTLSLRYFGVSEVNLARSNTLKRSFVLIKWANCGAKIFTLFWDIAIFVWGLFFFSESPCGNNSSVFPVWVCKWNKLSKPLLCLIDWQNWLINWFGDTSTITNFKWQRHNIQHQHIQETS